MDKPKYKPNSPPPHGMKLVDVPAYVESRTGNKPTLQSVYNWIGRGKNGDKLKFVFGTQNGKSVFADTRYTTPAWVDEFLARAGVN